MADVAASTESTGVTNFSTGGFTGDGTITNVTLGFVPRRIELINATDRIKQIWTVDMPANNTINTDAVGASTLNTAGLVVPTTSADVFHGFKIAAAAAISAKVYVWSAWG